MGDNTLLVYMLGVIGIMAFFAISAAVGFSKKNGRGDED